MLNVKKIVSKEGGQNFLFSPNPNNGYYSSFLMRIPDVVFESNKEKARILVIPNNTGFPLDDYDELLNLTVDSLNDFYFQYSDYRETTLLVPVFPREKKHEDIYTHALSRDIFLTDILRFKRLDLQLIEMIKDAKQWLRDGYSENRKIETYEKILMFGFSASGMFTNRFMTIHPDLVKGAMFGSPGGWPLVAQVSHDGDSLDYPVGIADLKELIGKDFDKQSYRRVKAFYFLGEHDENDSVTHRDGFSLEDENLIFSKFGATPVTRWEISNELLKLGGLDFTSKLFPNTGHNITKEINDALKIFFAENVHD